MIYANMPPFWDDVVLTACYHFNRAPSSVIEEQILFRMLLPQAKLFHVASKVCGYVCFVHLLGPEQDKLAP